MVLSVVGCINDRGRVFPRGQRIYCDFGSLSSDHFFIKSQKGEKRGRWTWSVIITIKTRSSSLPTWQKLDILIVSRVFDFSPRVGTVSQWGDRNLVGTFRKHLPHRDGGKQTGGYRRTQDETERGWCKSVSTCKEQERVSLRTSRRVGDRGNEQTRVRTVVYTST